VVVYVCRPCPVERDKSKGIHRPAENIFWDKNAFVPEQNLTLPRGVCSMFALTDPLEPIPVRVIAMFQPLVNKEIRGIAFESFTDELSHGESRRAERRIMAARHIPS
jgi:hypothetical protein